MAKDFRADQIRFHTIIASGTMWPDGPSAGDPPAGPNLRHPHLGMFVCSSSMMANSGGGFKTRGDGLVQAFQEFGQEPWLVFSGVANTGEWDRPDTAGGYPNGSAVLFMGDVIISGTLFGKRQVITVDKETPGDFHVEGEAFVSGNLFSSPTTYGPQTGDPAVPVDASDVFSIQRGSVSSPPKVGFRKTRWKTRTSFLASNKDSFVVFSGSKGTRGLDYGGIGLFEGDLHISGNLSVGGTWGSHSRDTILNNSASAPSDAAGPNTALSRGKFPHDWQNFPATADDPVTSAGPSFGHATTASAGGTSLAPFYVEQDRWQVHATQATKLHNGLAIPAFWYSDFVNSSSLDEPGTGGVNAKHLGGFRFIVAGSGSGVVDADTYKRLDYKRGRGNKLYSSVFMISGSGDIAIDPGKAVVFDSRMQNGAVGGNPEGWRRVQIKHMMTAGTGKNSQLIFSGSKGTPLHYQFVRGEVTGSGGFYLPPLDGIKNDGSAAAPPHVQGQMGQGLGIVFAGEPAIQLGNVGMFYSVAANDNPRYTTLPSVLVVTASHTTSRIKIGAGKDVNIVAHGGVLAFTSSGDTSITTLGSNNIELRPDGDVKMYPTGEEVEVFNTSDSGNTAFKIVAGTNGNVLKLSSRGSSGASYLAASGSGTAGAHTIKTVDGGGTNADLTIFPDGALIMSGTKNVSIDSDSTSGGTITIGGHASSPGQSVVLGRWNAGMATKIAMTGSNIQAKAGAGGLDFDIAGNTNLHTNPGNTVISTTGGTTEILGVGSPSTIKIHNNDTTNGIEIGLNTPVSAVPIFIGGTASTVTIGNDLSVGTLAHSGSVDVWGDMTVHGTFIKGHIITASMQDPLLFLNSGSLTANSGGGIAISSGSHETWKNGSEATFTPALVFGRDTTTSLDTFLVGRMDTGDGDAINLVGSQPIDIRAAGYRTAAGMTLTSSVEQGVVLSNPAANGTLRVHAGTTGGSLGNLIFSGSNYSFEAGSNQKLFLDVANNVYLQADQGTNRLDLVMASDGFRFAGAGPTVEFGNSNLSIQKGDGTNPDGLLLKSKYENPTNVCVTLFNGPHHRSTLLF